MTPLLAPVHDPATVDSLPAEELLIEYFASAARLARHARAVASGRHRAAEV